MWQAKPAEILLVLRSGQLECALRHGDSVQPITLAEPAYTPSDLIGMTAALGQLAQQLKRDQAPALPGCRIRVAVSDHWLAHASLPWRDAPAGWTRLALVQALEEAGYTAMANDTVRLQATHYGQAAWLLAWPEALLFALQTFAQTVAGQLVSVLPLSVLALQLAPQGAGLLDGDAYGITQPGGLGLPVQWRSGGDAVTALARQWQRLQLRAAADGDATLAVLNLDTSGASGALPKPLQALDVAGDSKLSPALRLLARKALRAGALDAIAPAAPARIWWAAAAVAAVVLAFSSHALWQAVDQRAQASGQTALQVALPRAHLIAAAPDPIQLARIAAANRAIGQLNLPLDTVLQSLVPDPDLHVSVLDVQLTTSVQRNGVAQAQITVAAQSDGSRPMADYVSALAQEPALRNVWLTQHEQQGTAYHFTVEASYP